MRSIPLRKAPDLDADELAGEQETPASRRSASSEPLVNLCARMPRELRAQLKARAVAEDRPLQDLVVEAVARYLDEAR